MEEVFLKCLPLQKRRRPLWKKQVCRKNRPNNTLKVFHPIGDHRVKLPERCILELPSAYYLFLDVFSIKDGIGTGSLLPPYSEYCSHGGKTLRRSITFYSTICLSIINSGLLPWRW